MSFQLRVKDSRMQCLFVKKIGAGTKLGQLKMYTEVIFKGNDAYHNFEDTKTIKLLINLVTWKRSRYAVPARSVTKSTGHRNYNYKKVLFLNYVVTHSTIVPKFHTDPQQQLFSIGNENRRHFDITLNQWCTTFFGRGPLIDFLIPSGDKQEGCISL